MRTMKKSKMICAAVLTGVLGAAPRLAWRPSWLAVLSGGSPGLQGAPVWAGAACRPLRGRGCVHT